jgi:hypothetical protein
MDLLAGDEAFLLSTATAEQLRCPKCRWLFI